MPGEAPRADCLNCRAAVVGKFCSACGQKATVTGLGFRDVMHEATHEFLHLDGKIWTTVRVLVTTPGQLTKEFIEGHRVRYVSPLRVYLTFSLLFFFLVAVLPGGMTSMIQVRVADAPSESHGLSLETRPLPE